MTNTPLNQTFTGHRLPGLRKGGLADWQVNAVRTLVLSDLEERHSLTRLAATAKLSVGHFGRAFHMTYGMSPMKYVRHIKVEAACSLMLDDALPLSEIALQCGFADQAHFSRVFRAITGHPPKQWQMKHTPAH